MKYVVTSTRVDPYTYDAFTEISWIDNEGKLEANSSINPHLVKEYEMHKGQKVFLSAQNNTPGARAIVQIWVDNKLFKEI